MNKLIVLAGIILIGGGVLFLSREDINENSGPLLENDTIFEEEEELEEDNSQDEEKTNVDIQTEGDDELSFVECLAEKGVIIYGSKTCPACASLAEEYGGYENMKPIYVECSEEWERCDKEMLVGYVPAIQINGELYDGWGSPENLAKETGCEL
jgi:hypothetical protein